MIFEFEWKAVVKRIIKWLDKTWDKVFASKTCADRILQEFEIE